MGAERSGGKTGRSSPGKTPIVVAVESTDDQKPNRNKLRRIERFKRRRVKSLTKGIIAEGARVVTDDLKCFADVADAMSQSQPDRASGRPVFQPSSGRTQPSATSNTPLLAHTGLFARITSHEPSPTSSGVSSSNAAATDAIARSD